MTADQERERELAKRIVKAIGDPGAVIGNRDWRSDERLIDWQTRAVLSVLPPLSPRPEVHVRDETVTEGGPTGGTWDQFLEHLDYVSEQNIGTEGVVPRDRLGRVQAAWAADIRRALGATRPAPTGGER